MRNALKQKRRLSTNRLEENRERKGKLDLRLKRKLELLFLGGLHIEVARFSEYRLYTFAFQVAFNILLVHRFFENRKHFAVCGKRVFNISIGVRKTHVVETAPQHAALNHFLLDKRFHFKRIASIF
jgi:hypothetical protein